MKRLHIFFNTEKQNIYQFAIIVFVIWVIYQLPYLNVFFSLQVVTCIAYIIAIFMFRISPRVTIILGLFFLCLSIPWVLIGSREYIEPLGEISFYILSVGFIQQAWKIRQGRE